MKRSLITTLAIGVAVAIVIGILHATKAIAGLEAGIGQLVSDYAGATRVVGKKWHYVFVLLIAAGVAWLSLKNPPPEGRLGFRGSALFIGFFSSRFPAFLQSH